MKPSPLLLRSPLLMITLQLGLLLLVIYYTFIGGQTAQGIYDYTWRSITLELTAFLLGGLVVVAVTEPD